MRQPNAKPGRVLSALSCWSRAAGWDILGPAWAARLGDEGAVTSGWLLKEAQVEELRLPRRGLGCPLTALALEEKMAH